jgi:hypothetical protein
MAKADRKRPQKDPGADVPVADGDSVLVIQAVNAFWHEADDAKRDRMEKNRINREAFFGRQNWSHKQDGQSTEFIPKTSTSIEQLASFVKRGLIKFGEWYAVELDRQLAPMVAGAQVRAILNTFFDDLWVGSNNQTTTLPLIISDCVKSGLMESLMILKVHLF